MRECGLEGRYAAGNDSGAGLYSIRIREVHRIFIHVIQGFVLLFLQEEIILSSAYRDPGIAQVLFLLLSTKIVPEFSRGQRGVLI